MRENTSEDLEVSAKFVRTTSCHCDCGNPTGTWIVCQFENLDILFSLYRTEISMY